MSKPILRVGKIKSTGPHGISAVDGHLSRSRPTPNANPEMSSQNFWLIGQPGELSNSVNAITLKAGIDPEKRRKDATIVNDLVLSISPTFFRPENPDAAGTWAEEKLSIFKSEAEAFIKSEFGNRIAWAVLHLDESTPHFQIGVVPIMGKKGGGYRLSGRDYFSPEKLTKLQDRWEQRLQKHGVGPRDRGSLATHTTVKSYYSALERVPQIEEPPPPTTPPMSALIPTQAGKKALSAWQKSEVESTKKRQRALDSAAAKGILYEAQKHSNEQLQDHIIQQSKIGHDLRLQIDSLKEKLILSKEQISVLRGVSLSEVANALGYTGEFQNKENAIDLVKRVGGLDYKDATQWLAIAFGPAAAGAAVAHRTATVAISVDDAPLTKADKAKVSVVKNQLNALDAEAYRVTIMRNVDGEKKGRNLCKSNDVERLWSKEEVIYNIPKLTVENIRDGNVLITPIDKNAHFALIDDLSPESMIEFKKLYTPCCITETSPSNYQAVVKIPKTVNAFAANEWFKAVNREFGDPKITSLERPMRLAGFQNRKEKHKQDNGLYPFVRFVEATLGFCRRARVVITAMAQQINPVSSRDETTSLKL